MTKKDYEKIAATLKDMRVDFPHDGLREDEYIAYMDGARHQFRLICENMTAMLANDNPRFDRARFLKACGLGS